HRCTQQARPCDPPVPAARFHRHTLPARMAINKERLDPRNLGATLDRRTPIHRSTGGAMVRVLAVLVVLTLSVPMMAAAQTPSAPAPAAPTPAPATSDQAPPAPA